jgi:hypothetical protein
MELSRSAIGCMCVNTMEYENCSMHTLVIWTVSMVRYRALSLGVGRRAVWAVLMYGAASS